MPPQRTDRHECEEEKLRLFPERLGTIRTAADAGRFTPHVFTPQYIRRALNDNHRLPAGVETDESAMHHDRATKWVVPPLAWKEFSERRRLPIRLTSRFFRIWARREQGRALWRDYAGALRLARRARDAVLYWRSNPPRSRRESLALRPTPRACSEGQRCKDALAKRLQLRSGSEQPCLYCSWTALKRSTADLVEYDTRHLHASFARLVVDLAESFEGERTYERLGALEMLGRSVRKRGGRWRRARRRNDWLCIVREVQLHYGLGEPYDLALIDLMRGAIECFRLLSGDENVWRDGQAKDFLQRAGFAPPPPGSLPPR